MNPEETMVENEQFDDGAADDTLQEDVVEETDESEESLESFVEDGGQPEEEIQDEPRSQGTSEPGWIKQRVNKAVERAVAETERRMRAEFDQQMAPIREKMLNDEARELVRQGEFKSLDRAKEYLQLKQGQPAAEPPAKEEQPRNAQGQFMPRNDPAIAAEINMLAHQADRIMESGGPDVISAFETDPEIRDAVIAGEVDFYEVAEYLKDQAPKKRPPSPMRSPNGVNGVGPDSIWAMSDEQFAKLDKRLDEGVRFTIKR